MQNAHCRAATFSLGGASFSLEVTESPFPLSPAMTEVVQNNIWALATSPPGYCKNQPCPGQKQAMPRASWELCCVWHTDVPVVLQLPVADKPILPCQDPLHQGNLHFICRRTRSCKTRSRRWLRNCQPLRKWCWSCKKNSTTL